MLTWLFHKLFGHPVTTHHPYLREPEPGNSFEEQNFVVDIRLIDGAARAEAPFLMTGTMDGNVPIVVVVAVAGQANLLRRMLEKEGIEYLEG